MPQLKVIIPADLNPTQFDFGTQVPGKISIINNSVAPIDNLTSTSTTAALSANQGNVLQETKMNKTTGTLQGGHVMLTTPDGLNNVESIVAQSTLEGAIGAGTYTNPLTLDARITALAPTNPNIGNLPAGGTKATPTVLAPADLSTLTKQGDYLVVPTTATAGYFALPDGTVEKLTVGDKVVYNSFTNTYSVSPAGDNQNSKEVPTPAITGNATTVPLVSTDVEGQLAELATLTKSNQTTASNGTNKTATGDIKLGGALTEATTITSTATNTLAIAGLQAGASTDEVVTINPTTGVLTKSPAVKETTVPTTASGLVSALTPAQITGMVYGLNTNISTGEIYTKTEDGIVTRTSGKTCIRFAVSEILTPQGTPTNTKVINHAFGDLTPRVELYVTEVNGVAELEQVKIENSEEGAGNAYWRRIDNNSIRIININSTQPIKVAGNIYSCVEQSGTPSGGTAVPTNLSNGVETPTAFPVLNTNGTGHDTPKQFLEYPTLAGFPTVGQVSRIYKDTLTGILYTWDAVNGQYTQTAKQKNTQLVGSTGAFVVKRLSTGDDTVDYISDTEFNVTSGSFIFNPSTGNTAAGNFNFTQGVNNKNATATSSSIIGGDLNKIQNSAGRNSLNIIGSKSCTLENQSVMGIYTSENSIVANSYLGVITGARNSNIFNSEGAGIYNGSNNSISTLKYGSIVGGIDNKINCTDGDSSGIFSGHNNRIGGTTATYSDDSVILGGENNEILNSNNACILGGTSNQLNSATYSSIIGSSNIIKSPAINTLFNANIIGGGSNRIEKLHALSAQSLNTVTIVGGANNTIISNPTTAEAQNNSIILGGNNNTSTPETGADTQSSAIIGGQGLRTQSFAQVVTGTWNDLQGSGFNNGGGGNSSNDKDRVFTIGNGTSNTARSNAYSITWDGIHDFNAGGRGLTADPAAGTEGMMYWNKTLKKFRFHNGTTWGDL